MPCIRDEVEEECQFDGESEHLYQCPALLGEQADEGIDADRDGELGTKADAHKGRPDEHVAGNLF